MRALPPPPDYPRRIAAMPAPPPYVDSPSSVWLSGTGAAARLPLLQCDFLALVLRAPCGERLPIGVSFQEAEAARNRPAGQRLDQNALGRGGDHRPGACPDAELPAVALWNYDLPLGGERNRCGVCLRLHGPTQTCRKSPTIAKS